jgi:hypothetical protein
LLKGQALSYFEHHLKKRLDAEDIDLPDNDLLELMMRDKGLEYIPRSAIRAQKYYMRRGLFLGQNESVQMFVERLNISTGTYFTYQKRTRNSLIKMKLLRFLTRQMHLSGMQTWWQLILIFSR